LLPSVSPHAPYLYSQNSESDRELQLSLRTCIPPCRNAFEVENMRMKITCRLSVCQETGLVPRPKSWRACVHIDDGEIRTLQHYNAFAHNPLRTKTRSGFAPVTQKLEVGLNCPDRHRWPASTMTWICSKRCAWRPLWPKAIQIADPPPLPAHSTLECQHGIGARRPHSNIENAPLLVPEPENAP